MIDDNNDTATEPAKRGRPVGTKTKRARRNYASELAELQSRVDVAVRLLRRVHPPEGSSIGDLVGTAIETLEGDK